MVWIASVTSYPQAETLPELIAISHQEIEQRVCAGQPCNAVAYYDHHASIIYFDSSLNMEKSITARSFMVHELVHYMQDQAGEMSALPLPCEDYIALEREAYLVQHRFLKQHNVPTYQLDMALSLLETVCQDEE